MLEDENESAEDDAFAEVDVSPRIISEDIDGGAKVLLRFMFYCKWLDLEIKEAPILALNDHR